MFTKQRWLTAHHVPYFFAAPTVHKWKIILQIEGGYRDGLKHQIRRNKGLIKLHDTIPIPLSDILPILMNEEATAHVLGPQYPIIKCTKLQLHVTNTFIR